jgi:hypothetical protein
MRKLVLILPLFFLFACSVQKRVYQKGFYVSNTKHHKTTTRIIKKEFESERLIIKTCALPLISDKNIELTASADNKLSFLNLHSPTHLKPINDSLCDIITLKNGDEVKATILELTPALVKYKKCGDPESPLYIAKKSDIFKIKYANGSVEVLNVEENKPIPKNDQNTSSSDHKGPLKTHPLAIWAFIYAILGLIPFLGIFTSIRAIIYGFQALQTIRSNPTEYKGDLLATAAIVIGIIGLALLLLLILALLAA